MGCTGGRVTNAGASVQGANVSIWTCSSTNDFKTTTDNNGVYTFNPYISNSNALNMKKLIPEGPIAIIVTSAGERSVTRRDHAYDEECDIIWNNQLQSLPCKRQDVALVPMTLPELIDAQLAFLEEDCGLATTLSPQARQSLIDRNPPPEQVGCLTATAQACASPSYAEFQSCMCVRVEASCGVSYGPACVRAAQSPRP
jgi:hypothetical protein